MSPKSFAAGALHQTLVHWGSLRCSPRPRCQLGRGTAPSHSCPLDAFDRCSWTFVETGRTDGHHQFLKRGCALGTTP